MKKSLSKLLFAAICMLTVYSCSKDEAGQYKMTIRPDASTGKDISIYSLGTSISGTTDYMWASGWTWNAREGYVRMLIDFDLSFISSSAKIQDAKLSLYGKPDAPNQHSPLSGSNACWIERITQSWDESTITWANQPETSTVNRVQLDESVTPDENYTDIDVTALVQDMVSQGSYGFMIKLQTEEAYRMMCFATSENADENLRPQLIVYFTE